MQVAKIQTSAPRKIALFQGRKNSDAANFMPEFHHYECLSYESSDDVFASDFAGCEVLVWHINTFSGDEEAKLIAENLANAGAKAYVAYFPQELEAGFELHRNSNPELDIEGIIQLSSEVQSQWESPKNFDNTNLPEIQSKFLPNNLQEFANALTAHAEVPESLPTMAIMGVLSTALCGKFVVSPKKGWRESVNIYTAIALLPASNKSLVLKNVIAPLIEWEKTARANAVQEIAKQTSKRKSMEKIIEGKRNSLAKSKNQKSEMAEIAEMEAALPQIQAMPKLFSNNCTAESLADETHEQGGKFALISDEGGAFEVLAGLYSNGKANVDIVLKGIDGGHLRIKRKNYEYDLQPLLTMLLIVQPQILLNMSESRAFTGNGMLERFLFVVPPSNLGYRTHVTPDIPSQLTEQYAATITTLLNIKIQDEVNTLTLSPDAYTIWHEFRLEVEKEMRPSGKMGNCGGWGGKISGFTLRLAGLIHVCEKLGGNSEIPEQTMTKALAMARILCEHAVAAFGEMGASQNESDAKEISKWLAASDICSFTKTEIYNAMRGKNLCKADRISSALEILAARKFISEPLSKPTQNNSKPTTYYEVNPKIKR